VGQCAHLYCARTCTVSIFEHGFFCNPTANVGVLVAVALGCFVVYTPGLQDIVQTRNPFSLYIFYGGLLSAGVLFVWTEGRKWFTRTYPEHYLNKYLAW
jgi:hypothetical protein